jgi:hypothetical protein
VLEVLDAGRLTVLLCLAALAAATLDGKLERARVTELADPAVVARQLVAELTDPLAVRAEAVGMLLAVAQRVADRLNLLTVRLAQAAPHQMVGLSYVLALVVQVDPEEGADLFLLAVTADNLCLCGQVPLNKR